MVSCKLSNVRSTKVNPDDVVNVRIIDDETFTKEAEAADPTARDSVDVDNSLTPFEHMAQKMLDALREAYNLDPTGEFRGVAVMVTVDKGKIWNVMADSTEAQVYTGQEVWTKAYVEAEIAKTQTAYHPPAAAMSVKKASPI